MNTKRTKEIIKATKMIHNFDISSSETPEFVYLLAEALGMRDAGLSWKEIDKAIEEKIELKAWRS